MLNPTAARVSLDLGGIDLAIRFGTGDWPGLTSELLFHTDFVIAAARSLVGDRRVAHPQDLLEFPWLQEIGTTETNDWLAARGVRAGRVKSLTQLPGNLLLDGLRTGQGVVAATRTFIEADLARGDVVVLFEDDRRGFGYFLLHRPGRSARPPRPLPTGSGDRRARAPHRVAMTGPACQDRCGVATKTCGEFT